ncbi:MAG: M48 family metalloprotease [Chlamydiia bacterium]|nr:M48 family metalloprotease [Chlamydiia bacterium]
MELTCRFLLNIVFASLFTFYGAWGIILIIRPFIRHFRTLHYLYLLPFIKVLWDVFFMDRSKWIFLKGQSVLDAIPDTRFLTASVWSKGSFARLKFHLLDQSTFSLGDLYAELFPYPIVLFTTFVIGLGTILSLLFWGIRLFKGLKWERSLQLIKEGKKGLFITTDPLSSPIVVGFWKSRIIFPHHLISIMSQEELQAIYLHEKEHSLWKDNLTSLIFEAISALFWFIPYRKTVLKKASFYRELACDAKASPLTVVTALQKIATTPFPHLSFSSSDRAHWILHKPMPRKKRLVLSTLLLMGGGMAVLKSHFFPF